MMRRFSSGVVRSTSLTWSDQVLPTTVQTGAPESRSAWMLASPSGVPPTRQVAPKAAIRAAGRRRVPGRAKRSAYADVIQPTTAAPEQGTRPQHLRRAFRLARRPRQHCHSGIRALHT